jgi:4-hydroxybenzoate polyprenyltransferase
MRFVRRYFEFVRFEHTVFALPFALAAMAGARGDSSVVGGEWMN